MVYLEDGGQRSSILHQPQLHGNLRRPYLRKKKKNCLFLTCMSACLLVSPVCSVCRGQRDDCGHWEWNQVPLEEIPVFLTAETSLHQHTRQDELFHQNEK